MSVNFCSQWCQADPTPFIGHTAGPIVMNTEEEVQQVHIKGLKGFEGAREWNSFVAREDDVFHEKEISDCTKKSVLQ